MNKKYIYAGIAAVVVIIIVIMVMKSRKDKNEQKSFDYVVDTPESLATFDELVAMGYTETEAKQIINSESYKQGVKNY